MGSLVPVSAWANYQINGCSKLVGWIDSDDANVECKEFTISVPTSLIAQASDDMALDLQLPKPISVVMHIRNQGLITQENFIFSYQWQRDGRAQPIAGAKRVGCFLKIGERYSRLPYTLYKIADGIDRINETLSDNISERLLKWHEIECYFPKETSNSITVDGFLGSTKVYSAHAFELTVKHENNGLILIQFFCDQKRKDDSEYL